MKRQRRSWGSLGLASELALAIVQAPPLSSTFAVSSHERRLYGRPRRLSSSELVQKGSMMSTTEPRESGTVQSERTFTSAEMVQLCGLSSRQLNYWDAQGRFGIYRGGKGQGHPRRWVYPDLVLARALFLASQLSGRYPKAGAGEAYADLVEACITDRALAGCRLVIEPERVYLARALAVRAALVVNLTSCARHVRKRLGELDWQNERAS